MKNAVDIANLIVKDESGQTVATAPTFGRTEFEVRFDWQVATKYKVFPNSGKPLSIAAPKQKPEFALRVHAPLGQNQYDYFFSSLKEAPAPSPIRIRADKGETVDILIEVEKLSGERPTVLNVSFKSTGKSDDGPNGNAPHDALLSSDINSENATLRFEFDKAIWQRRLSLKKGLSGDTAFIVLERNGQPFKVPVVVTQRDADASTVAVKNWEMPVDALGLYQPQRLPEQIAPPNPVWHKIGTFFNVQTEQVNFFEPFVYQRLDIENKQVYPLNLLLKSKVVDERTGKGVSWFSAPDFSMSKGPKKDEGILGYCQIPAQSRGNCVLPIYMKPDTPAGTYTRQIDVYPMGSSRRIKQMKKAFSVVRSNSLLSFWLVMIVVISLGWLGITIGFYRRLVNRFGVRLLVLISLLGAMQFCLEFGSRLASTALYAFLGPFNCLVGGLLSEVATYLIITSVLYLSPRVGTITLAGIISYLMGGILFGSFGLSDILFTGSTIAFREILLFSMRVTKMTPSSEYIPSIVPMMLALGIADAMSTFTSLTLHSVFYRLFFADWYIVLNVVVTGFFYTVIGVYWGRTLGRNLRKVHA
ncbi:MAG: hypothetical protein JXR76_15960 [Deltaproteobacteria bacterium]|nr:hypothetical protein [Deltaproteobacteria bacterium]